MHFYLLVLCLLGGEYADLSVGNLFINERLSVHTVQIDGDYDIQDDDVFVRLEGEFEGNAVIRLPDAEENPGRVLFFNNGMEAHTHSGGVSFETVTPDQNALYPMQAVFNLVPMRLQEESYPYLDVLMTWYDEIYSVFPYGASNPAWLVTASSQSRINHVFLRNNGRNFRADNFRLFPVIDKLKILFWYQDMTWAPDTIGTITIHSYPRFHPLEGVRLPGWSSESAPRFSDMQRQWGMYGEPDSIMIYTADSAGGLWVTSIQTDSLLNARSTWNPYRQILSNVGRFSATSQAWGTHLIVYQTFDGDSVYMYNVLNDVKVGLGATSVPTYPVVIAEYIDGACSVMYIFQSDEDTSQFIVSRSQNGYPISQEYSSSRDNMTQPFMDPGSPASEWAMLSVFTVIDTTGTLKISFPCNADDMISFGGLDRVVELPFDVYPDAPVIARRNMASEAVIAWHDPQGYGPYTALVWFLDAGQSCALISDGQRWSVLSR